MAICSGVAAVLYWPIEDSAVCEGFMPSEKTDALERTGVNCSEVNPNFLASASILSLPRSEPTLPKTVLQEYRRAIRSVAFLQGMLPSFFSSVVVPGIVHGSGDFVFSPAELYRPFSRAAAAVTTLKVEPGGYVSRSARLSVGSAGLF